MAGKYGTWNVPEDAHVSVGNDDFDIPAGEYTPSTAEEALAVQTLASSSCQRPGEEHAWAMAELVDGPAEDAEEAPAAADANVGVTVPADGTQATISNSPAGSEGTSAAPGGPAGDLAAAEDELSKAEADVAAAEAAASPPAKP